MTDLDVNKAESEALVAMMFKQTEKLNGHIDEIQRVVNQIIQDPALSGHWKDSWQGAQQMIDNEQKNMIQQFHQGSGLLNNVTEAYKDVDKVAAQYFM
ncbi:hypothetical protein ACWEV3_08525 [Saccharopolyspora sp. NPDC003752]